MVTLNIRLNTVDKVKDFVSKAGKCIYNIDIKSNRYTVDGKSILGIFSLDLSNDLELHINCDDENDAEVVKFIDSIKQHLI